MAASRQDISDWFDRGVEEEATHLIVVCDTYDYEDYPVYVRKGEDPHEIHKSHNGPNMQKVMEVYNLGLDKESQMAEHRASNF